MSIFTKATNTVKQKEAQATKCKTLVENWKEADESKEAVRDQLVTLFSGYLKADQDSLKECKQAVVKFLGHLGYSDIKELCEGEGININTEFSMIKKVSSLLVDCKTMRDVRKAYDANRKARSQASGGKAGKAGKAGNASASTAASTAAPVAPVADTPNEPNLEAPQMVGALLEEFNKLSQMDNIAQHRVAELIKAARKELHKEAQEALKIAKDKKAA